MNLLVFGAAVGPAILVFALLFGAWVRHLSALEALVEMGLSWTDGEWPEDEALSHFAIDISQRVGALNSNVRSWSQVGLLFTVIGLMMTFYAVSDGGGATPSEAIERLLREGLGLAMSTTALGISGGMVLRAALSGLVKTAEKVWRAALKEESIREQVDQGAGASRVVESSRQRSHV